MTLYFFRKYNNLFPAFIAFELKIIGAKITKSLLCHGKQQGIIIIIFAGLLLKGWLADEHIGEFTGKN
jgi:hypothetical protein